MRIGIVNDVSLAAEALRRVVVGAPEHEVAWIARDGAEAVRMCQSDKPDVVLMDLVMPVMNGVEATKRIMLESPCPILVVTATVSGNFSLVYDAMGLGALDAVNTPVLDKNGQVSGAAELLRKIDLVARTARATPRLSNSAPLKTPRADDFDEQSFPLVAIGASTGGPQAVGDVLQALPGDLHAAILVVQHITQDFAAGLAQWLGQRSRLPVSVARAGEKIEPRRVYLAGTNDHMVIKPPRSLEYTPHPLDNPMRPSVDELFTSLAEHWVRPGIALVLTGMGRDGAAGLLRLKQRNWHTIAQEPSDCVVPGMPGAAIQAGAARQILPLAQIGPALLQRLRFSPSSRS